MGETVQPNSGPAPAAAPVWDKKRALKTYQVRRWGAKYFDINAGGRVSVASEIKGDLVVAGGELSLGGAVEDNLYAAGGSVQLDAIVSGNARVAGGEVTEFGPILLGCDPPALWRDEEDALLQLFVGAGLGGDEVGNLGQPLSGKKSGQIR
jgi:hypothetical protein